MTVRGNRMRAARIVAPERVEIEAVALPDPTPGQVRFRVEGSGVCASNLGPWHGLPWIRYPLGPGESGHEAWGIVDAVGREASGFVPGERVAAISYSAYAEYDVADAAALIRLPEALAGAPFTAEPLGCALNIFERARIGPGQDVAIVGIGFLGALLTRLSVAAGARVIAVSRRKDSLELARRFGASEVIPLEDHRGIIERVAELTEGKLCDRVIEATGKQWPLDLAAELTKVRGTLVIAGYHQGEPRQVNLQLWNWRGLDVVNAHERDVARYVHGVRSAIGAVLSGRIDPRPLFTHTFRLEELGAAFAATSERPPGFTKALVCP